jgi:ubiquinone/menaquinone biosynthesis C-methylase UbiE
MTHSTEMKRIDFTCKVCGADSMARFLRIEEAPAHIGVLWRDRRSALGCPKGDIELCFCDVCGFVYNTAFDAIYMVYEEGYDNALDFSGVFSDYARSLASALVNRYRLRGKNAIDIGCGLGEFLKTLCDAGDIRGVGFDPSAPIDASDERVSFVREYYSRAHSDVPADLITCRHVLEHIEDPIAFLTELRATIGERGTPVFFEVPSLRNIVAGNSPWEIIYEHCSYFGEEAMTRVFERCGFEVEDVGSLYNDLYLGLWARPASGPIGASLPDTRLDGLRELVEGFSTRFEERIAAWRERIEAMRSGGRKAVAWGAGARGTSFVNLLDAGDRIRYLVDINPRKRGKYVPGTGQEIVAPERLVEIRPDVVIVMNPVYLNEIRNTVTSLGVDAEFLIA